MVLGVDSVSLLPKGPSVTFSLSPGQSVGIFGPSGSGKSLLCRVLAGAEKPKRGEVKLPMTVVASDAKLANRRTTPLVVAQKFAGAGGPGRVADALTAARLWDKRKEPAANLSDGEIAALHLIPVLASQGRMMVIDCMLDRLDPWAMDSVMAALARRLREGAAMVLATNRPDFAPRMDTLVVLQKSAIVFAGSYQDLERSIPSAVIEVETHNQPGVRALVQPFEIEMKKLDSGAIEIKSKEGQKLAAKLLTEGYGDVKAIISKRISPDELLRSLIT